MSVKMYRLPLRQLKAKAILENRCTMIRIPMKMPANYLPGGYIYPNGTLGVKYQIDDDISNRLNFPWFAYTDNTTPGQFWGFYTVPLRMSIEPDRFKHIPVTKRSTEIKLQITSWKFERLGEINDEGSRKEGFNNLAEFLDNCPMLYNMLVHGTPKGKTDLNMPVWAIEFERIKR